MNKYEIMFIVKPTLGEEDVTKVAENFKDVLTKNGAKVIEFTSLGQKELAYEIKKFKNGYYFLTVIEANDDKAINEFNRLSLINGDMLRHLIIKLDK